MILLLLLLE